MVTTIISFLQVNWVQVLIAIVFIGVLITLWKFGKKEMVLNTIKRLVIEAEKRYGSKTGVLKLAIVWAGLYEKLPWYVRLAFPKKELEEYIQKAVEWLNDQLKIKDVNLLGYYEEIASEVKSQATEPTKESELNE